MKIGDKPYRILSLDGGGTWALIQAKVLMDMYGADTDGEKILANFDLVAANSGGGIVAAGLIANLTPAKILNLFFDGNLRVRPRFAARLAVSYLWT
jgi:patatin-like phospholipase/acyl hydrolase